MVPISYTDTDQIRAAIGVDAQDVSDDQIVARNLHKELRLDLSGWLPSHAALYEAGTTGSPSDTDTDIADAIQLYSSYFCALNMISAIRLAGPQSVSDGKNTLSRFSVIDWAAIEDYLKGQLRFYKDMVLSLQSSTTSASTYPMFSGAGLATDPVTSG